MVERVFMVSCMSCRNHPFPSILFCIGGSAFAVPECPMAELSERHRILWNVAEPTMRRQSINLLTIHVRARSRLGGDVRGEILVNVPYIYYRVQVAKPRVHVTLKEEKRKQKGAARELDVRLHLATTLLVLNYIYI